EVVRMAEEQGATIIAMSDHGFGPIRWYFAINNWLLDQGYLVLKGGAFNRFRRLAFRLGFTPNTAYKLLIALGLQNLRQSAGIGSRHTIFAQLSRVFLSLQDVDWSRTRAYSKGNYGQIYVNTKGREKHGVVAPGAEAAALRKEIAEKVAEVRDPETGGPMFQVFLQDDIYSGDQAWRGCDVFPLPVNMEYKALGTMDFITNKFLEPSYAQSGDHRVDGIFFMKGEGVRAGQWIEGARVFDVAPTVLHRMGLPIPKDMDGVPLTQCYEPGWLEGRAPAYSDDVSSGTSVDQELTEDELAQIQENLKGLGYLG
ncbi:MAG: alkaline phosphatase family protein, partial [Candidatus Methylomirabilis sp.]|nr:alkaline phosphatase family protein [Deltaproteobacteria bacterium]